MSVESDIAAVQGNQSLNEDQKRHQTYVIKTTALIDVILHGKPAPGLIQPMLGRTITHQGFTFRIDSASATGQSALLLDVTFNRPPGQSVVNRITFVNPPVLPRSRTGNEKQDLIQAVHEMLEGFV